VFTADESLNGKLEVEIGQVQDTRLYVYSMPKDEFDEASGYAEINEKKET